MKSYKKVSLWFILFIFFLTVSFASNIYKMEYWSRLVAVPVNIILFWGIPVIAWIVGKVRKIVL